MKFLLYTLFILLSGTLLAQGRVVIDRDAKTEQIFDESQPYSLLSLLKLNAWYYGFDDLKGVDIAVYNGLQPDEKAQFLCYKGPEKDVPLLDEDPNSPDFGKELIREMPDGLLYFVYPDRDSVLIQISGVDRIVFTVNEGSGSVYERLNQIQLWKQFSTGMHCVLQMNAARIMSFHEMNAFERLSPEWTEKIMGTKEQPSLWTVLRDTTLANYAHYKAQSVDSIYDGWMMNNAHDLFPSPLSASFLTPPFFYLHTSAEQFDQTLNPYYDWNAIFPVSFQLLEEIWDYSTIPNAHFHYFDSVYYLYEQSSIPLVDEDPDSPNYGMEKLVEIDGLYYYLYGAPEIKYFFADYEPVIFVSKQIRCDSLNNCQLVPTNLIFCIDLGEDRMEIVSLFSLDLDDPTKGRAHFKRYLEGFPVENLWSKKEFVSLKALINSKKYFVR